MTIDQEVFKSKSFQFNFSMHFLERKVNKTWKQQFLTTVHPSLTKGTSPISQNSNQEAAFSVVLASTPIESLSFTDSSVCDFAKRTFMRSLFDMVFSALSEDIEAVSIAYFYRPSSKSVN